MKFVVLILVGLRLVACTPYRGPITNAPPPSGMSQIR